LLGGKLPLLTQFAFEGLFQRHQQTANEKLTSGIALADNQMHAKAIVTFSEGIKLCVLHLHLFSELERLMSLDM